MAIARAAHIAAITVIIWVLNLTVYTYPAHAEELMIDQIKAQAALVQCTDVTTNEARLQCYDLIYRINNPAICAVIGDVTIRLACYDRVFQNETIVAQLTTPPVVPAPTQVAFTPPPPTQPDPKEDLIEQALLTPDIAGIVPDTPKDYGWQTDIRDASELRPKKISLTLQANTPHLNGFGENKYPELVIVCENGETTTRIFFGGEFMTTVQNKGNVTYAIDGNKENKQEMLESKDTFSLGLWYGDVSIPFVKKLLSRKKLFVKAEPLSVDAVSATFNLSGIDEAIEPLRKECGW